MPKFTIRLVLVTVCLSVVELLSASGQTTNAAGTNAPSATLPAAAIALADVVSQAQADTSQLQEDSAGVTSDPTLQSIGEKLPGLISQIDDQTTSDSHLLVSSPTLGNLQPSQATWESLSDKLASAQKDLSLRVQGLDTHLWQLSQMDDKWKATYDGAKKVNAPPAITQRIQEIRALIASTTKAVRSSLAPLYSMQNLVAAQDVRTQSGLDTVNKAIDNARIDLFKQNRPALWNPGSLSLANGGIVNPERISLHEQLVALKAYLDEKIGAVLVHLFLLALLVMGFYWIRNTIHLQAREKPALQLAARVFDVPLATALLLALLATWFLYPEPPRLLWAIAGAIALIPAVIVTRRLIDPENFPILYATMIAYFVDQVRYVITPAGVLARFLLIVELLAVSVFLLTALRSKHLSESSLESNRLKRLTRIYLHLAFLVFVFAGFANVLGYVHLSVLVGEGMLDSSYLAVILYAAVRIVDALAISALNFRPLSTLGMVHRHQDLLYNNITAGIRWLIFGIWLVVALQNFTLRDLLWQETGKMLNTQVDWFFISFKVGAVVAFPITVWATFLLSRFIRFVLEEEVYPQFPMGRGVPYAASTMVHYIVLLLGFFAAVAATGAPLSQFSFLAGAFGVGLGFGLQNIFNNFVSGIILLFERPVKVGDTIQIGADIGRVERIGIRASVILLGNGSEMIVPNGNLISNPVTNWTLSNCERVIEIPVNVVSKVDPQHVLNLLTEVAKAHPSVIKNPPPQALLVTFGAAALSFRLRAWIDSEEEWMKITSDLSLAINAALTKENIALGDAAAAK